jgi:hypothetical protein
VIERDEIKEIMEIHRAGHTPSHSEGRDERRDGPADRHPGATAEALASEPPDEAPEAPH